MHPGNALERSRREAETWRWCLSGKPFESIRLSHLAKRACCQPESLFPGLKAEVHFAGFSLNVWLFQK